MVTGVTGVTAVRRCRAMAGEDPRYRVQGATQIFFVVWKWKMCVSPVGDGKIYCSLLMSPELMSPELWTIRYLFRLFQIEDLIS